MRSTPPPQAKNSGTSLRKLISDYQERVRAAVLLMQDSGLKTPWEPSSWKRDGFAQEGRLNGNAYYFQHGIGCTVRLPAGTIDFDFWDEDASRYFSPYDLTRFAGAALKDYGFTTSAEVADAFKQAVSEGWLSSADEPLSKLYSVLPLGQEMT